MYYSTRLDKESVIYQLEVSTYNYDYNKINKR